MQRFTAKQIASVLSSALAQLAADRESPVPADEIARVAHVLAAVGNREVAAADATEQIETQSLHKMLEAIVSFGNNNQMGDVRTGDIAGRDIVHILQIIVNQKSSDLANQAEVVPQKQPLLAQSVTPEQREAWQRMLEQRRQALLLINERISEYVEEQDVPLQLRKNQRQTLAQIRDLEAKLTPPLE